MNVTCFKIGFDNYVDLHSFCKINLQFKCLQKIFTGPLNFKLKTYLLKSKDTVWKGSLANLQNTYLRIFYKPGDPIDTERS